MRGPVVGVFLLLAVLPAAATTVPRRSLEELVAEAGEIVQARVQRHWVEWDASHRFLWTHYLVKVSDILKGPGGSEWIISEAGGTLDGLTMAVPGVVQYADGEEVVVFLHRVPNGMWRTYGYGQGKFTVVGGSGGSARVVGQARGLTLVDAPDARRRRGMPLPALDGARLADFKQLVRRMVQGRAVR